MTKEQISFFRAGYWEARGITIHELKRIVKIKWGYKKEIQKFIDELEADERREYWESVQDECPGITKEQYELELEAEMQLIREEFFQKNGMSKLRLLRSPAKSDVT